MTWPNMALTKHDLRPNLVSNWEREPWRGREEKRKREKKRKRKRRIREEKFKQDQRYGTTKFEYGFYDFRMELGIDLNRYMFVGCGL